ncbi:Mediator of replication checkpoint protein 1 [Diplodia seriata]|uniref:Mediator of replication checkpoint protein 1 n=1 Tax=Diplodia seriata TaxID=420778 RepID=A0A1S8BBQ7_9PEZI|nr:Mediator of replication checkpoint protein 1 [Diplodia seriata]
MQTSRPPIELTPRSRVKAMLAEAGMSDDSEDELSTKPSNAPLKPSEPAANPAPAASKPAQGDASSDSEEDDIIPARRPIGRMAARMLAEDQNAPSGDGDKEDGNAYQRVRKMLMSAKDKQKESSGRSIPAADAESSSGEDMPFSRPTPARRLARKASKSPKPAASASRASSPGLFVSPSKASPAKSTGSFENGSNSDSGMSDFKPKSRLEELVAQKKAERKAKEAAEKKTREENRRKAKAAEKKSNEIDRELNGSETDSNDEEGVAEKLTQQARPTRRAGKKAKEEMNRETQRIARNMQLAHQAKTKKKYTTQDLFKRFNFGQPQESAENTPELASSDVDQAEKETPPTSQPSVDEVEKSTTHEQGIDSNGLPDDTVVDIGKPTKTDIGLPVLHKAHPQPKIDKGKGRAILPSRENPAQIAPEPIAKPAAPAPVPEKKTRTFRVVLPERPVANASDSDDDLEIVRDKRFDVFDSLPARQAKEPKHLLTLRHLAHLTSPSKSRQTDRSSMGPDQLQALLQRRAREQAKAEKDERIAELRAKGIMVQTEEERERDQLELENLLEKARKEADELAKKEKDEAKKNGDDDGDGLLDSEDDESYVEDGSDAEGAEDEELELSGSEDEEEDRADGEGLLDDEAGEDEDDEMADEEDVSAQPDVEAPEDDDGESEEDTAPAQRRTVVARNRKRVFDDEDEESEAKPTEQQAQHEPSQDETMAAFGFANNAAPIGLTQMFTSTAADTTSQPTKQKSQPNPSQDETMVAFGFADNDAPVDLGEMFVGTMVNMDSKSTEHQPQSEATQDETMAAFGFANNAAPAGLSQMFNGTMANTGSQSEIAEGANTQQDSLDFLRNIPISTIPEFAADFSGPSQDSFIRDSQVGESQAESGNNDINIGISQFPSQPQEYPDTQMSDVPEPTQDGGFAVSRTPGRFNRTPQASSTQKTVDTVIFEGATPESPIVQRKKGRLQRRREIVATAVSDVEEDAQTEPNDAISDAAASDEEFAISADAFNVMRKGAKKAKKVEAFNKKKSAAKEMVYEQAEESEDEYAGLGGASDDESGGEMDEELKDMIDEAKVKVNEREIAAFHANKERVEDEKRIDKLYKDITNGNLRRKRGGDFGSLDDSDDEAAERRAKKQREFARMRKALLADENIGKIADNPKRLAFLRAIEDHDEDEDEDFFDYKDSTAPEESQSQSIPDSQEAAQETSTTTAAQANPLKRKAPPTTESNDENRPPARQRRTAAVPDRKPTTRAEIRESLSSLIDEPLVRETQFSASEDEDEDADGDEQQQQQQVQVSTTTRASFTARRTAAPIVDRLTLSRSASAASSTTTTSTTTEQQQTSAKPLAFAGPATTGVLHGFKVPSLLRRATTNLSTTSTTSNNSSSSTTTTSNNNNNSNAAAASAADQAGLRRGGSKKSNIHYQAREAERKKAVVAVEARREEGLRKKVVKGRGRSVLGALGGGGFE